MIAIFSFVYKKSKTNLAVWLIIALKKVNKLVFPPFH